MLTMFLGLQSYKKNGKPKDYTHKKATTKDKFS